MDYFIKKMIFDVYKTTDDTFILDTHSFHNTVLEHHLFEVERMYRSAKKRRRPNQKNEIYVRFVNDTKLNAIAMEVESYPVICSNIGIYTSFYNIVSILSTYKHFFPNVGNINKCIGELTPIIHITDSSAVVFFKFADSKYRSRNSERRVKRRFSDRGRRYS